jgi:hypothetical protein
MGNKKNSKKSQKDKYIKLGIECFLFQNILVRLYFIFYLKKVLILYIKSRKLSNYPPRIFADASSGVAR